MAWRIYLILIGNIGTFLTYAQTSEGKAKPEFEFSKPAELTGKVDPNPFTSTSTPSSDVLSNIPLDFLGGSNSLISRSSLDRVPSSNPEELFPSPLPPQSEVPPLPDFETSNLLNGFQLPPGTHDNIFNGNGSTDGFFIESSTGNSFQRDTRLLTEHHLPKPPIPQLPITSEPIETNTGVHSTSSSPHNRNVPELKITELPRETSLKPTSNIRVRPKLNVNAPQSFWSVENRNLFNEVPSNVENSPNFREPSEIFGNLNIPLNFPLEALTATSMPRVEMTSPNNVQASVNADTSFQGSLQVPFISNQGASEIPNSATRQPNRAPVFPDLSGTPAFRGELSDQQRNRIDLSRPSARVDPANEQILVDDVFSVRSSQAALSNRNQERMRFLENRGPLDLNQTPFNLNNGQLNADQQTGLSTNVFANNRQQFGNADQFGLRPLQNPATTTPNRGQPFPTTASLPIPLNANMFMRLSPPLEITTMDQTRLLNRNNQRRVNTDIANRNIRRQMPTQSRMRPLPVFPIASPTEQRLAGFRRFLVPDVHPAFLQGWGLSNYPISMLSLPFDMFDDFDGDETLFFQGHNNMMRVNDIYDQLLDFSGRRSPTFVNRQQPLRRRISNQVPPPPPLISSTRDVLRRQWAAPPDTSPFMDNFAIPFFDSGFFGLGPLLMADINVKSVTKKKIKAVSKQNATKNMLNKIGLKRKPKFERTTIKVTKENKVF